MPNLRKRIEEILNELEYQFYVNKNESKFQQEEDNKNGNSKIEAINQILQAFEEMLPEEEKINPLCKCSTPWETIKDNLVWCNFCNRQIGEKTWNVCLAQIRERIGKR